jgi:uncharacterized protein (DUF2062 family)
MFIAFLKQGLSPEKLALCVALGCVVGIFPVLGSTTILCAAIAWVLGLNQPAIQSVNYLVYPLQLAFLIPFFRMGEWLFRVPRMSLSVQDVKRLIQSGVLNAIHILLDTTMRAIVVWGLLAPLVIGVLYLAFLPFFRRLARSEGV